MQDRCSSATFCGESYYKMASLWYDLTDVSDKTRAVSRLRQHMITLININNSVSALV